MSFSNADTGSKTADPYVAKNKEQPELTEKVMTEMHLPAAEYMFRGQSALVEPSGLL